MTFFQKKANKSTEYEILNHYFTLTSVITDTIKDAGNYNQ